MLNQDLIAKAVRQGKAYSHSLVIKIKTYRESGESLRCLENKLIVVTNWTRILENYYKLHYTTNGTVDSYDDCFTEAQMIKLAGKMNAIADCLYVSDKVWLLATGFWNDNGYWIDTAYWNDYPNFN